MIRIYQSNRLEGGSNSSHRFDKNILYLNCINLVDHQFSINLIVIKLYAWLALVYLAVVSVKFQMV